MANTPTRSQLSSSPVSNGHSKATHSNPVLDIGERAYDAVSSAATVAQKEITKAASSTEKVVKANPLASLGVALGGGVLLGVLAAKLFSHKPTLAESFHEQLGLKRKIARAIQSWL